MRNQIPEKHWSIGYTADEQLYYTVRELLF